MALWLVEQSEGLPARVWNIITAHTQAQDHTAHTCTLTHKHAHTKQFTYDWKATRVLSEKGELGFD